MVAGMKFLSKKGFNPQNMHNQRTVWEARQAEKKEEQKIRERQDQLKRERDDEELAKARGEPLHLKFMYSPPPGMEASSQANKQQGTDDIQAEQDVRGSRKSSSSSTATNSARVQAGDDDITKVQDGDDAAAAAFRLMLASASGHEDQEQDKKQSAQPGSRVGDGTVLQGTSIESEAKGKGGLSALEKAVGRRDGNQSLSLDEQTARFPQLKNAPMAKGMSGSNVGVSFKPLGAQLRNVRCLACGIWGHSRGERECPKSGWNPFALKPAPSAAAKASTPDTTKESSQAQSTDKKSHHRKRSSDERSSSQSSQSEDSYRERKRRKKSSKRRKKESKRSRKRYRSESPDRKRRRRARSESYSADEDRAGRPRKSSKKSCR